MDKRHATPLAPVLEFLERHAPFDRLFPAHREYLAKRLKLVFHGRGEAVTGPEEGPAGAFFIIKQGRVRGELGTEEPESDGEGAWELVPGECFPIGALLAHRPVRTVIRAAEDTFCFVLEREHFDELLHRSVVFNDFCTRRLANLLDNAFRSVQATSVARVSQDTSLSSPLQSLIRREPVSCVADTRVGDALAAMDREHVGSIVVTDGSGTPIGMFTLHDVLSRVALPHRSPETPIGELMSPSPLSLPPEARAYEAALLMAHHGFGHVCVVRDGRLVGVVSERDLFSLQRIGLVNLSRSIGRAETIGQLAQLGGNVYRLVEQMLAQGASVAQITEIITVLNDGLTRRTIHLILAESGTPAIDFTWLAFGSEGRCEQTLKTDQDNGVLFHTPEGMTADAVRAELLPLAKRINDALASIGFPLCPGNIMAGNPECCLSAEEWKGRFSQWIDQGTPEHLLKATIFFDFRPLYGDPASAQALRDWLLRQTGGNDRFRRQLAENALANRPPLGLVRDFRLSTGGEHPHTLDTKLHGLTPFVDGARLIALGHGIGATGTVARLRAAAGAKVIPREDADAWIEAYNYIQLLRIRQHHRQAEQGLPMSNHVDPDTLNALDRRILKEAFRQARKLQSAIAMDYQL